MRRWKAFPAVIGALGAIVLGAAGADAQLRPFPGAGGRQRHLLGGGPAAPDARVARHPGTGLVTFLPGDAGATPAGPAVAAPATAEGSARAFLGANAASFGIADPGADLRVIREDARPAGGTLLRYRQLVGGIPVFGGEVHVAVGADRRVRWASAETIAPGPIALEPAVDAAAARAAALAATAAKYALPASALAAGEAALEVYDEAVFTPERRAPGLVWRLEVTASARPVRELVLVDARRGTVRLAFNQIDAAKELATYDMGHSPETEVHPLPGAFVCDESDLSCTAGDADAKGAHKYASDTYDYFLGLLGRDGIDGAGMTMVSSVNYVNEVGGAYQNAFWSGEQMVYGEGFATADDVVGHELAHGVMEHTAGLFYWAESGAINESFSDLHGEFVDQRNLAGNDGAGTPWYMGEDLPIGPIRNMADPTDFSDPDRIGSPHYYSGLSDNAGVHYNSGVNNKAVFLMAAGGSFNGQTIASLGSNDKVAWLYYNVQAGGCLTPAANYNDLATCLRAECDALAAEPAAGMPVLTAADCAEVRKALLAVEMDARPGQRFVDDTHGKMTYQGSWAAVEEGGMGWVDDSYHESVKPGNTAKVKFSGNRLWVLASSWGMGGVLDLYLDSTAKKIGSINQATSAAWGVFLKDLPSGTHTLIMKHAKGESVSIDAVASYAKAAALPVGDLTDFNYGRTYPPWELQYLTYKGAWFVWPGNDSWSYKTGDSVAFTFTGNAFGIWYYADPADPNLGKLQVLRDGKLLKTLDQRAVNPDYCYDYYGYVYCFKPFSGFSKGKHTVTLKHYSGARVNVDGVGAYDLTLP